MRKRLQLLALGFGGLSGCNPSVADYCAPGTPECTSSDGGTGRDAAAEAGAEAGAEASACDPGKDPSDEACVVAERYGVFVSPAGSDASAGTRSSPVATIGHALDLAKASGKRVYVCAGTFREQVRVDGARDGVNVYGGFDCAGWTYGAANQVVVAPPSRGYPLEIEGLQTGVTLEDLEFDAQNAASPGESSIAAFASNSQNVSLRRVTLVAGIASDGSSGTASGSDAGATNWFGTPPSYAELNGASAGDAGGAPATTCTCADRSSSTGGPGSGPLNVPPPTAGLPSYGDGGAGAAGVSGNACNSQGGGGNGADAPVVMGTAPANALGVCLANGWTPNSGTPGTNGLPGQGGGGGGDGRLLNGSGGGGACGGCGGLGGKPGAGGGSSMALLAYQSSVALTECLLTSKAAGRGGSGSEGEQGEGGGVMGGDGSLGGCQAGAGGAGTGGNGGQGGAGGLSLGIGYCGTPPTIEGASVPQAASLGGITVGTAGMGGTGGSGGAAAANSTGSAGASGPAGPSGASMAVRSLP